MLISISIMIRFAAICLICGLVSVQAQPAPDKWQRVYTSEAFITDIDPSSLSFESTVLRVHSRTILTEPISVSRDTDAKYKTAQQTVEFRLDGKQYRLPTTDFLDINDKVLRSSTADDWRDVRTGGVMDSVWRILSTVSPFGTWKITDYRFAEGDPGKPAPELERLVGTMVRLGSTRAEVRSKECSPLVLQDQRYTKDEFARKLGVDLKSIGIDADVVETINVKCESRQWQPPQSLLIKGANEEMLMLWNGVFLVLHKESQSADSSKPKVIRRLPKPDNE